MPRPALTYQGGKYRIAQWVISHFPPHDIYLEPFGGAANVLLNKPRSAIEVYNDLDGNVWSVFKVMQDKEMAAELEHRLKYTPYSRNEWELAFAEREPEDIIERARRTIVRAFMSISADGATRKYRTGFGLKLNDNGEKFANSKTWRGYHKCIALFHERLQGVTLENKDAFKLIEYMDRPNALIYVDPPYVNSLWNSHARYKKNLDNDEQKALLDLLKKSKAMVVLSGYDSELYRNELDDWKMSQKETLNQVRDKRIECIWINQNCQKHINRQAFLWGGVAV